MMMIANVAHICHGAARKVSIMSDCLYPAFL